MNKKIASLLLVFVGLSSFAVADSYDPATNRLTIDSIQVSGTTYTNVVVTLGSVVSVGGNVPGASSAPVAATCSLSNLQRYTQIQVGMTVDQVNRALGCSYDSSQTVRVTGGNQYTWHTPMEIGSLMMVLVYFDGSGAVMNGSDGPMVGASGF